MFLFEILSEFVKNKFKLFTYFLTVLLLVIIYFTLEHNSSNNTQQYIENKDTVEIKISLVDTQAVYAGRYDTVPTNSTKVKSNKSKYFKNGSPIGRNWLTLDEWKGNHCKSFAQRKAFKKWKRHQIDSFIEYMSQAAVVETRVFPDIPPELIVAQAILESNFGKSKLASQANNYFGHKYRGNNANLFVVAHDDSPYDKFSIYRSTWFSLRGHSHLLMNKYRKRISGKPTLNNWLYALCGGLTAEQSKEWRDKGNTVYATSCLTDVCYSQKLKSIINIYSLKERCSKFTKIGSV